MKYLIVDYDSSNNFLFSNVSSKPKYFRCFLNKFRIGKYLKKTQVFKKYQLYKQYRQLHLQRKDITWNGMELIHITLPFLPKDKDGLFPERIQNLILDSLDLLPKKKLVLFAGKRFRKNICPQEERNIFMSENSIYLLEAQKELESYIPYQIPRCEDKDEIYIKIINSVITNLCQYGYIQKRSARLFFLDDGSRNTGDYIKTLSKDWNYVTVYSNHHKDFEDLYWVLYEEEGLMVECTGPGMAGSSGDIVIDLTKGWKGIHRVYPAGSYVLDVTFSHEKEKYLRVKHVRISGYLQAANIEDGYRFITFE